MNGNRGNGVDKLGFYWWNVLTQNIRYVAVPPMFGRVQVSDVFFCRYDTSWAVVQGHSRILLCTCEQVP